MSSSRDNEAAIEMAQGSDAAVVAADEPRSRRELLRTGGAAALVGTLGVFGIATAAEAKNGSNVKAGEKTSATKPTTLESRKGPALQGRATGSGAQVGVRGAAKSSKGIGVQGIAESSKGPTVGVQGQSKSSGGTAGQFVASGTGTALQATAAKKGVALHTEGRLEFSGRSGSAVVSEGGAEFVVEVVGELTEKSLVLATLQDHRPGVHVEAAYVLDAEKGLIVVRLNQAVAEQSTVAWFVLG